MRDEAAVLLEPCGRQPPCSLSSGAGAGKGVNGQSFHGPMILRLSAARRQEREWRQPLPYFWVS